MVLEVRVVWQPTQFNIPVRGIHRSAYSDDRAVHVLYHVLRMILSCKAGPLLRRSNRATEMTMLNFRDYAIEQSTNY